MKDHGVSSSDLDRARELSRRLSAFPGKIPPSPKSSGAVGYVRFAAPPIQPRIAEPTAAQEVVSPVAAPSPAARLSPPPSDDATSWETLLQWVHENLAATAAFIVDDQGFVIANRGAIPDDGFEALGAELCLAFEQLERVDPSAGNLSWLDLEFSQRRIAALRGRLPDKAAMLFVAIAPTAPYIECRSEIEKVVMNRMARLF